ncbi:hypothetical protein EVAR_45720_1 [Eumeta japonica]|uniref:Uncharacterized protein n=1 Tax=Eumeta variegata TaxID=151549 RepID=A0A4C1WVE0_EUMVA|nr:hypothetical protein EVAR_45720_1 [Eumeta japonica]
MEGQIQGQRQRSELARMRHHNRWRAGVRQYLNNSRVAFVALVVSALLRKRNPPLRSAMMRAHDCGLMPD